MFNLFNETSILPKDVLNIEKSFAKTIAKSAEFKVLLIKCQSEFPSTPRSYNVLIGDNIFGLAKKLSEKFGDKLDSVTTLKFSECFYSEVEDRSIPVQRFIIESEEISNSQRTELWKHDLKLSNIILKELLKIQELAYWIKKT